MPSTSRRTCLKFAAASTIMTATGGLRAQEAYPNRTIKLVYPLAAGTGGDLIARVTAAAMTPILGQSVMVDNKVGAGGTIGMGYVAKSAPDGYTLVLGPIGATILIPAMNDKVTYNIERDFEPVAYLGHTGFVVVTREQPDMPRTLQELVATLKSKSGDYSSVGSGTAVQLGAELFLKRAGVKATHIGYRGSSEALTALAGGNVLFSFDTPAVTMPLIKAGKLRALAVTSAARNPSLPDVPTIAESGFKDFEATAWWGILAPKGTPAHVVKQLSDAAVRAVGDPEVRARFAGMGAEANPQPAAEFSRIIKRDDPLWGNLIKELKIKVDG